MRFIVRGAWGAAVAVVAGLGLGAACSSGGGDGAEGPKKGGAVVVRVVPAKAESVQEVIELSGTLMGGEEITVAAEVDAPVEAVLADMGDRVKAGDPLVRLDVEDLRLRADQAEAEYQQSRARLGDGPGKFSPDNAAAVRRARADLEEGKRNLARGEELSRRDVSSAAELDALKTKVAMADAALQSALEEARSTAATADSRRATSELARKRVRDAIIRSPVEGAVSKRLVSPGEFVKVGQAVARVVVTKTLKLQGEVPERYVADVKPGLVVTAESDALPGKTLSGTLSRVSPEVNASSRTFTVEALIPDPDGRLKPGLFARASIEVGRSTEVFAVPETAVASVAGVHKVYVEAGGKATARDVRLLRKRASDALLVGKLEPGERIIVTGVSRLFDGIDVTVDQAGPATSSAAPGSGPTPAPSAVPSANK